MTIDMGAAAEDVPTTELQVEAQIGASAIEEKRERPKFAVTLSKSEIEEDLFGLADATCVGEKSINGKDCFILKLAADHRTLKARSEGPIEIICHSLIGYFSQRTGLLVRMEDSYLTRIHSDGGDAVYWETNTSSFLDDYRPVEGIMVAYSGRSIVTLFRFGDTTMSHKKTRMEEAWTIDEVAFNVPGLFYPAAGFC